MQIKLPVIWETEIGSFIVDSDASTGVFFGEDSEEKKSKNVEGLRRMGFSDSIYPVNGITDHTM